MRAADVTLTVEIFKFSRIDSFGFLGVGFGALELDSWCAGYCCATEQTFYYYRGLSYPYSWSLLDWRRSD